MSREHDAHFPGLYVAQCAKREAWKTGGNISTSGGVESRHAQPEICPARMPGEETRSGASGFVRSTNGGHRSISRAGVAPGPLTNLSFDAPIVQMSDKARPGPLYALIVLCGMHGLPLPVPEYQFHPRRKWRFDYAWPTHMLALEVEGGIWRQGGGAHSHPLNIERDMAKYSEAAVLGWRILRVAPEHLRSAGLDYIRRALL